MLKIDRLVRSRRKTIALIVTPEGQLEVRAPQRATRAQIEAFVAAKAEWIRAHQAKALAKPRPKPLEFAENASLPYLGHSYPLRLASGQKTALELRDGAFLLNPAALPGAAAVFTAWVKRQARVLLAERVRLHSARLGLQPAAVRISSARTRWGSCSSRGTLSFTWRLALAPLEVVDYVVIHELVHLAVKNHSRDFWQQVAAAYPAYQPAKTWLREHAGLGIELLV